MLIFNTVEFLLEKCLFIVPFIEVKDFTIPRKQLIWLFKLGLITGDLRVNINCSRNLKFNGEHLSGFRESPHFQDSCLESLWDLNYMPIGLKNHIIHVSDKRSDTLMFRFVTSCRGYYLFIILHYLAYFTPVRLLIFEPFTKVFLWRWTIFDLAILNRKRDANIKKWITRGTRPLPPQPHPLPHRTLHLIRLSCTTAASLLLRLHTRISRLLTLQCARAPAGNEIWWPSPARFFAPCQAKNGWPLLPSSFRKIPKSFQERRWSDSCQRQTGNQGTRL